MTKFSYLQYLLIAICISLATNCKQAGTTPASYQTKHGVALVELFTSQGCSSCPPAETLANKIVAESQEGLIVLTYHVDYWDRLGWKDPFSQHKFSERQQQYARHFKLNGVYTPQVVVNGSTEFIGSNEKRLRAEISKFSTPGSLLLQAKRLQNSLTVTWQYSGQPHTVLNFAIVQPAATTSVTRGENSGRQLHHSNVVRTFKTLPALPSGSLSLAIPPDLQGQPLMVAAFSQINADLAINAATITMLN